MGRQSMPDGSENTAGKPRPVSLSSRLGYGIGDFGFVMLWQGGALFLLYFYTEILGLPAAIAGAIYLAGMIWDAVSDPFVATWTERKARQIGRYRGLIGSAALPLALAYPLLFTTPFETVPLAAAWALATHIAFRTAYTFASMPYNTMPARLTREAGPRNALAALRVMGAATGALLVALASPVLIEALTAQMGAASAYLVTALVIGAAAGFSLWACAGLMSEPRQDMPDTRSNGSPSSYRRDFLRAVRGALSDGRFARLMVVMALATISFGLYTQTVLYLVDYHFDRPDLAPLALGMPALVMIFLAPAWAFLANHLSKPATMMAGLATAALGYAGLGLGGADQPAVGLAFMALAAAGNACLPVMFWSLLPDAIDTFEARTGERIEARMFGLATFIQKSAAGLAGLVIGVTLALAGHTPDTPPDDTVRLAVILLCSAGPAVCLVTLLWIVRDYARLKDATAPA
ncbi:MFS transporter [Maricaulis parjimensis]|uniref:MFS transporter n=1 Tax=Maricaulis parjimensis TaxID=144023 RepID=UPI0019393B1C|nr:MFS transporter [Maricaulis parjimensis]